MINEQNVLKDLVIKFLNANLLIVKDNNKKGIELASQLIIENDYLAAIDKNNSIKCLFDYQCFNPSIDMTIDQMVASDIKISNASFDVLYNDTGNKELSVEVVLCIKEFEFNNKEDKQQEGQKNDNDTNTDNNNNNKSTGEYINVNQIPEVKEKLIDLYYNYLKETLNKKESNMNHHLSINAESFIRSKFNRERDYSSIRKILSKKSPFSLFYLDKEKNMFIFYIRDIQSLFPDKENKNNNNNKAQLDFRELFYKHPSQESKLLKDFSEYEAINLKEYAFSMKESNKDNLLGKKHEREGDEDEIPLVIQELYEKMKDKPAMTITTFDEYKSIKKSNI